MTSGSDDAPHGWDAMAVGGELYDGEFADRLEVAENAARAAEEKAARALSAAEKWETECEFLLKRVSALEVAVERLTITRSRPSSPPESKPH